MRRLSGRRICEGAGDPFPVHVDDLASMLRCRERGGQAIQRDDDRPAVIEQRLAVYHSQTRPILEYYADTGLLRHVDASGSAAAVARLVLKLFAAESRTEDAAAVSAHQQWEHDTCGPDGGLATAHRERERLRGWSSAGVSHEQ
jgi:hypothetical protein